MARSPKTKKPTTVAPTTSVVAPTPSVVAPTPRLLPPQPPRALPNPPTQTAASRITSTISSSSSVTKSSRPVRESAVRALEQIKQHAKTDSETEGEESDWSINEDGVDDDLADALYDFFKNEKRSDKLNSDVYSYILNVMEDKEDYDSDNSKMVKLKALLPMINTKFKNYYREIEEDSNGKPPELTIDVLEKYMIAGLDDEYEDDGWIVNDI